MTRERIISLNNTYFILTVLHLTSLGQFQLRQPIQKAMAGNEIVVS